LAVAQIDHTPMDVIVVDEEHRQPIQRPSLTVVIDVYSRMVLGFSIYLEKPSAFTVGMAISHAILPKENWLAGVGVQAEWPCWGKMRTIHCDNAKEFRGTVIGRACQDHDITIEHRPPREPRYGGHIERGFGTWLARARRLKGTTFSNVVQKGDYDSEGHAILTRAELGKWFTIYVTKVYANALEAFTRVELSNGESAPLLCREGFDLAGHSIALAARIHRLHAVVVGRLRREVVQVHAEDRR
jgi:putative transposase